MELRALLGNFGNDWAELDERIWLLSLDSNLLEPNSTTPSTSAAKSNPSGGGGGGKKSKGKKNSKGASTASATAASKAVATLADNTINRQLDAVDVLDLSSSERQKKIQAQIAVSDTSNTSSSKIPPLEISDEHTIATLVISFNALRLPQTTAKLYSRAIEEIQKSIKSQPTNDLIQQLCGLLTQGYLSHLKLVATIPSFTPKSIMERVENARATLKAWEEAQFLAMILVKYSAEALHQSWLILAVVEHYESCKSLLALLEDNKDDIDHSDEGESKKLTQKIGMLPRLAEMMTMKQIKAFREEGSDKFSPSVDDVRLFVECLEIQSKFEEAVDLLTDLGFNHLEEEKKTDLVGRKINDENDVNDHVGSLIQITEKEAFEIKVRLLSKLKRHDEVFAIYSKILLRLMPDQWCYWVEMLKYSAMCSDQDRCLDVCKEVLERVLDEEQKKKLDGKGPKVPIRGPHLFAVEMAAYRLDNANGLTESALTDLSKEIVNYGSIFASIVFCCFQDIRRYLAPLVEKSTKNGAFSDCVRYVLDWALTLRQDNDPIKLEGIEDTPTAKQERRSKLRAYIASVKICFEIWFQLCSRCKGDIGLIEEINQSIDPYIPTSEEMIAHWQNTMDLGSNPKDGGQKEYLPGDDLILLTIQLLLQKEPSEKTNLTCLVLTEIAMHHSPYNPYIKIMAIQMHTKVGSANRSWEVFEDMNIKQIQLDSCSYFILQHLVQLGLYNQAIKQAGKIISLHSSSEKDLCSFMGKAMENGNLEKGREMIQWQREKMRRSLQLLEAKGLIMDLAPLLNMGDSNPQIGAIHGVCGKENDVLRVEKMIRDSANSNAAPSILSLGSEEDNGVNNWSDNRDFDVNQFEILYKNSYPLSPNESFARAHIHAVLTRLVLLSDATKHPKKGKIVKLKDGEKLDRRSKSLCLALKKADIFLSTHFWKRSTVHAILWKLTRNLSKVTCILASGRKDGDSPVDPSDSLNQREKGCIAALEEALIELENLSSSDSFSVHKIVPDILITAFVSFRITSNMCNKFGWGRRKRDTKPVAGCLARVAKILHDFVNEIMTRYEANPVGTEILKEALDDGSMEESLAMVSNVRQAGEKLIQDIIFNHEDLRSRLLPVLKEMKDEFGSFNCVD